MVSGVFNLDCWKFLFPRDCRWLLARWIFVFPLFYLVNSRVFRLLLLAVFLVAAVLNISSQLVSVWWETRQELSDHLLAPGLLDCIKHSRHAVLLIVVLRIVGGDDSHFWLDLYECLQKSGRLGKLVSQLGLTEVRSLMLCLRRALLALGNQGLLDQEI